MLVERPPERGSPGVGSFRQSFVAEPQSALAARRRLELLRGRVDEAVLYGLTVLVTELVANSVKHSHSGLGDVVQLHVSLFGDCVRAEVIDQGAGFDPDELAGPRAGGEGGWGLFILDRMAESWGVDHDQSTRVWFEIPRVDSGRAKV